MNGRVQSGTSYRSRWLFMASNSWRIPGGFGSNELIDRLLRDQSQAPELGGTGREAVRVAHCHESTLLCESHLKSQQPLSRSADECLKFAEY